MKWIFIVRVLHETDRKLDWCSQTSRFVQWQVKPLQQTTVGEKYHTRYRSSGTATERGTNEQVPSSLMQPGHGYCRDSMEGKQGVPRTGSDGGRCGSCSVWVPQKCVNYWWDFLSDKMTVHKFSPKPPAQLFVQPANRGCTYGRPLNSDERLIVLHINSLSSPSLSCLLRFIHYGI